jgi:surface protein
VGKDGNETVILGVGRVYNELGATATDDVDTTAPEVTIDSTAVEVDIIGEYSVTYSATDEVGNTAQVLRTVSVVEPRPFITTWKTDNDGSSEDNELLISTNPDYASDYAYTVDWGDGKTTDESGDAIHVYDVANTYTVTISGDFPQLYFDRDDNEKLLTVEQWGDIKWSSGYLFFLDASNFTSVATDTPDLRGVSDLSSMFEGATAFNSDISDWDVSNVTNMSSMFYEASAFNQDLSSWDVSNVTSMEGMFSEASEFNQDLSSWDVSNVTNMEVMFSEASEFNQDIGAWDVSNVIEMDYMFARAIVFNQDISAWDVSKVEDMEGIFYQAFSFDQDLSTWQIPMVTSLRDMLLDAPLSTANYDALLISFAEQVEQGKSEAVDFTGTNVAIRSSASDDAVATLIAQGWTF